jgi:hypothetical protein
VKGAVVRGGKRDDFFRGKKAVYKRSKTTEIILM